VPSGEKRTFEEDSKRGGGPELEPSIRLSKLSSGSGDFTKKQFGVTSPGNRLATGGHPRFKGAGERLQGDMIEPIRMKERVPRRRVS